MAPSISVTVLMVGSGEKMVGLADGGQAGRDGLRGATREERRGRDETAPPFRCGDTGEQRNDSIVPLRKKEKAPARGARRRRAQRRRSRQ